MRSRHRDRGYARDQTIPVGRIPADHEHSAIVGGVGHRSWHGRAGGWFLLEAPSPGRVSVAVLRRLGSRLDDARLLDMLGHGRSHRVESAAPDHCQKRGAIAASVRDMHRGNRQPEDLARELPPEGVLRAAARHANPLHLLAGGGHEIQTILEPVQDALQHGAGEMVSLMPRGDAGEGCSQRGIVVRCPLATQVGVEVQPIASGGGGEAAADQFVEGSVRLERVAIPPKASAGAEHAAHEMAGIPDGMAERVHRPGWVGRGTLAGREDHAGGAEIDGHGTRVVDATCKTRRRLIAGTGDHRCACSQAGQCGGLRGDLARDLPALEDLGKPGRVDTKAIEDFTGPMPAGDVEQRGSGGVRGIRRVPARQFQSDGVLGQQDVLDAGVDVRLVPAYPEQLRRGETCQRRFPGDLDEPPFAEALVHECALFDGSLIIPEHGRSQHLLSGVEQYEPVHLAGKADAGHFITGCVRIRDQAADDIQAGQPPVRGILFRPTGPRGRQLIPRLRGGVYPSRFLLDEHATSAAGTNIEAEHKPLICHVFAAYQAWLVGCHGGSAVPIGDDT